MIGKFLDRLRNNTELWEQFKDSFTKIEVPGKTILLKEGEIANKLYFIEKGCLRMWFNKDGKDITLQFFFEGQPVASIESFMGDQPSLFSLETIEHSALVSIGKPDFRKLLNADQGLRDGFQDVIYQRLGNYSHLFLSRIKDTPQERYNDLLKNHPEIVKRIPQHYIASYLGITPISLSRIRNRK